MKLILKSNNNDTLNKYTFKKKFIIKNISMLFKLGYFTSSLKIKSYESLSLLRGD